MNSKTIPRFIVAGLLLSLWGCASYVPPSGGRTASVQGSTLARGYRVVILEINEKPLISSARSLTGMCYEPEPDDLHRVAPGNCTLKVKAYNGGGSYGLLTGWSTKGTVSFVADAGKNYSVMAKIKNHLLTPDQAEFYVVEK